jgi:acyl carrier protein
MSRRDQIIEILFGVIEQLNLQLPSEERLSVSEDTIIMGPRATLDSLGLVNLIVAAENKLQSSVSPDINLTDAVTAGGSQPTFSTLGDLAKFVARQIDREPET